MTKGPCSKDNSAAEGAGAAGEIAGAAVDDNFLALNVRGIARSEEQHGAGDLFGFGPTLERDDHGQAFVHGGDLLRRAGALPERGARVAGRDHVDEYAARAQLRG